MPENESEYQEIKLLSLLADDSEYAFQVLFDRHRSRIYSAGLRYLKSPILAQEVVQDVFLKLWFSRHTLKPDGPIGAWLNAVAHNNIVNRLRRLAREWKATRELQRIDMAVANYAEDRLQDLHYSQLLREAIAHLPVQQRTVFLLAREQSMTYGQIAAQLSLSPLTVKTHMSRALDSIRKELAEKGIILSSLLIILL